MAAIREKRNKKLSEHFLEGLEEKLYFIMDYFNHTKDEVRVHVVFDLDYFKIGLLDLSRYRYNLLPSINFFEDGCYEFDDSEWTESRPYSTEREWQEIVTRKPVRKQAEFRRNVLRIYNYQCAVCSICTKKLLRAAHIIPVANGGNESVSNGICLCTNHEVAYDRGILKIDPEGNTWVNEGEAINVEYSKIHLPLNIEDYPSKENLRVRYEIGGVWTKIGKFGEVAIKAAAAMDSSTLINPLDSWNKITIEIFGEGTSSQRKGCPRGAFVGLCEAGLVRGIPQGNYSERRNSQKNKEYAIKAVQLLKENPLLIKNKNALWESVMDGKAIKHNSQMDVVLALWKDGRIS